ncbi:hypothetical protein U1707_19030, partial [Sphingomonas sp. PB2P12]|uniref:hypothetical protein n=1 Tax=Sphingomonas sandaracina TaxID=3096157 RepID=UPI002FC84A3A
RVHTTNDITGCLRRGHQLGRAVRVGLCQVRMIIISARLLVMMMSISGASNRSLGSLAPKRSRTAEAILVPKIEHLTASILKNPFTMSNTGRLDPITVLSHGEPFLFINLDCG